MEQLDVFIASSEAALPIASAIKSVLEDTSSGLNGGLKLRDLCRVTLWKDIVHPGETFLAALMRQVAASDFAVFVFHPTDEGRVGGRDLSLVRDNVVFEYGLFVGRLGPRRTFAVLPRDHEGLRQMTDAAGITHLLYDRVGDDASAAAIRSAVRNACDDISARVVDLGACRSRRYWQQRPLVEPLLSSGLTRLYERRMDAVGDMLRDLETAHRSVTMIARVYLSLLVKDEERLAEALLSGLPEATAEDRQQPFVLEYISTNPADEPTVQVLHAIEDSPGRRWRTAEKYAQDHLRDDSDGAFDGLVEELGRHLASLRERGPGWDRKVLLRRRHLTNYLTPHSMLIVDDRILYVGFYTFNRTKNYGSFSPTMRLARNDYGQAEWLDLFLEEARRTLGRHVGQPVAEHVL